MIERANNNVYGLASGIIRCGFAFGNSLLVTDFNAMRDNSNTKCYCLALGIVRCGGLLV